MDKIYNLGIVGYGSMAEVHEKQLSCGNVRVKICGVFDISENRRNLAEQRGHKVYSSLEALLSDESIDIVLVSTTNETHKDIAVKALKAKKHVLVEKPATITASEMKQIIKASKKANKVFTIDQNRRMNRDFISMVRNIEKGAIGDVYVIESRVEGSRGMPEGWRCDKAKGGGMMLDWGVHLIDQIMHFDKSTVTNVFCKMFSVNYPEVDDNFRLILTFESGLVAHIEVSTNNFIKHQRFYALGTLGTLEITDWDGTGRIIRKTSDDNNWQDEIKPVKAGPTKTMAPRDLSTQEEIILEEVTDVSDNLDPVYQQLINAIEGGELKIKPEEALRVIKVMEKAFASAKSGKAIACRI